MTPVQRLSESSSIVTTREIGPTVYEVCATEMAEFDAETSMLVLTLGSFVRKVNQRGPDTVTHPAWLPAPQTVRLHVSREEAPDEAREAFQVWRRKIASAVPGTEDFAKSV